MAPQQHGGATTCDACLDHRRPKALQGPCEKHHPQMHPPVDSHYTDSGRDEKRGDSHGEDVLTADMGADHPRASAANQAAEIVESEDKCGVHRGFFCLHKIPV